MKQGFHVAYSQGRPQLRNYRCLRSAGLLMSGGAALFLGCAAAPEKAVRAPNSAIPIHLADVRPGGLSAQRPKIALIALPDRIYEIPMNPAGRSAFAPANVAASGSPVVRSADAFKTATLAPLNVALAGAMPVVFPVIEPATVAVKTTAQPDDSPAVQLVALATTVQAAAESSAQRPVVQMRSDEKPALAHTAALTANAATDAPKLKLDTDYESVRHPLMFAFNRSTLGRQAQALLAKILPDARVATEVKLTGYSDSIGTRAANERVAVARAHSIRDELVKNDVEPGKISVEPVVVMGLAKTRQPAWYYAQYRRVDVDITKRKPAQMISMADTLSPSK
jgi:outer membrane protein OmpA-like peptidoglycan-associated protein